MPTISNDRAEEIMRICQAEAEKAIQTGNPPFACVGVDKSGKIVTQSHNTQNSDHDPTAHAEIKALRELGSLFQSTYLDDFTVFANAESCAMCLFACIKARIGEYYFGAAPEDRVDNWISVQEIANHTNPTPAIHSRILEKECAAQISRARQSIPFRSTQN